jgi:hypothetical protein
VTQSDHLESNGERRDGNELERAAIGGCGVAVRRLSGVAGVVGDREGVGIGGGLVGGIGIRKFRSEGKDGEMGKKESDGTVVPAAQVERGRRRGVKLSKLLQKSGPTWGRVVL